MTNTRRSDIRALEKEHRKWRHDAHELGLRCAIEILRARERRAKAKGSKR